MNYQKLSKEERAEWLGLPVTKAAIELIRTFSKAYGEKALIELRNDSVSDATMHAGAEEATRNIANLLESD